MVLKVEFAVMLLSGVLLLLIGGRFSRRKEMRLVPAEAGKFRQGQVYVRPAGRVVVIHSLDEQVSPGKWQDRRDKVSVYEKQLVSDGWYLIDPSDDPAPVAPEPKRDEFWEKCFLAALLGFSVNPSNTGVGFAKIAALQADACVAERKSSGGAM